jgi:hypothetical protein
MQKDSFPKNSPVPLLTSIEGGARMLGLGRSKTLQLVYAGEIESVLIGKRRLLKIASIQRLAETGADNFCVRLRAQASITARPYEPWPQKNELWALRRRLGHRRNILWRARIPGRTSVSGAKNDRCVAARISR